MKTVLIASSIVSLALVASAAGPIPEYKVITREVNKGKDQVYLRVELKATPTAHVSGPIESLCKSLDTEGARKFVVFVHLPGKGADSAYASCGRLPKGEGVEVRLL